MDFDFSDLVGPFSALAAFVSAAIAYQANRNVAKSDRVRQVREVSLLANKVVAATIHIDDLSNELEMGYQTLFMFAGQGGSSRLKLYVDEVERSKQRSARCNRQPGACWITIRRNSAMSRSLTGCWNLRGIWRTLTASEKNSITISPQLSRRTSVDELAACIQGGPA